MINSTSQIRASASSPGRRIAWRVGLALAATLIGVGSLAIATEPAAAQPCREMCPSFEPFSLLGSGYFYAPDRWGRYSKWFWFDWRTPNGGITRECRRQDPDTGNIVGDACPR